MRRPSEAQQYRDDHSDDGGDGGDDPAVNTPVWMSGAPGEFLAVLRGRMLRDASSCRTLYDRVSLRSDMSRFRTSKRASRASASIGRRGAVRCAGPELVQVALHIVAERLGIQAVRGVR